VSDEIRTRDRRDHNPKDLVVPTPFVPYLLGFTPSELVPLVLRLVHELVHGIKAAARPPAGQDSSCWAVAVTSGNLRRRLLIDESRSEQRGPPDARNSSFA
jgi:hypothetical protein